MSTNTESVLSAISSYNTEHKRPCPAKFLKDSFGDVSEALEALKASGVVIARRGRNGGLTVSAPAADSVQEPIASVG